MHFYFYSLHDELEKLLFQIKHGINYFYLHFYPIKLNETKLKAKLIICHNKVSII